MRLKIDTTGVEFRVAGAARPKKDWKDKDRQATLRDGRLLWTLRLSAYDEANASTEMIWVEFVGDEPQVIPNEVAIVHGLTYAPWASVKVVDGKPKAEIMRAFRADSISMAAGARRAA